MIDAEGSLAACEVAGGAKLLPARKTKKWSFCLVGDSSIVTMSELPGCSAKNRSDEGNSTRVTPDLARPSRMIGFSLPLTVTLASPDRYSGGLETRVNGAMEAWLADLSWRLRALLLFRLGIEE